MQQGLEIEAHLGRHEVDGCGVATVAAADVLDKFLEGVGVALSGLQVELVGHNAERTVGQAYTCKKN